MRPDRVPPILARRQQTAEHLGPTAPNDQQKLAPAPLRGGPVQRKPAHPPPCVATPRTLGGVFPPRHVASRQCGRLPRSRCGPFRQCRAQSQPLVSDRSLLPCDAQPHPALARPIVDFFVAQMASGLKEGSRIESRPIWQTRSPVLATRHVGLAGRLLDDLLDERSFPRRVARRVEAPP
jgi:hypothetical protein